MKNNTITGERLKECRIAAGYKKQEDIAKILNVTRQNVSLHETGERFPKVDDLIKLAKLYKTSTDYLLGLTDIKTTDTELKAICEYTGLTEEAIHNIKCANSLVTEHEKTISDILAQKRIFSMLFDISEYLEF